jgi:hypothetical protein
MNFDYRPVRMMKLPLVLMIFMSMTAVALTTTFADHANATTTFLTCRSSQIRVTAGATTTNTDYTVRTSTGIHLAAAYEEVPVSFFNRGAACHLLMNAPIFQAVRNTTTLSAATPSRDLSMPAGADNTKREVVLRHQKTRALFVVIKPVGSSFIGCEPATASGFSVRDIGSPLNAVHFVPRELHEVCFDSGAGAHISNIGAIWEAVSK